MKEISGDTILVLIIVLLLMIIMGFSFTTGGLWNLRTKVAVLEEKVAALEDVVFNYDLYEKIKKEATNGER